MRVFAGLSLLVSTSVVADPFPPQLPIHQATAPTYYMEIYVRHPLLMPLVRHHDYRYTAVIPQTVVTLDGQIYQTTQVVQTEINWGWDNRRFRLLRPFASLHSPVPGRMETIQHSEQLAARTPTITRYHQRQITEAAYNSQMQHAAALYAGQRGYTAVPHGLPGTDNCITAGIPPIVGTLRPGVGMFAAPRILRAMDRGGFTVR